jgi:hypothetical protein
LLLVRLVRLVRLVLQVRLVLRRWWFPQFWILWPCDGLFSWRLASLRFSPLQAWFQGRLEWSQAFERMLR